MGYTVACDCGRTVNVEAQQAGSTVRCGCSREIDVPRLSQLRESAGESPIPHGTIDRIRAMIAGGELPLDELCPLSGRPADETVYFRIHCEQAWVREGWSGGKAIASVLLFGWIGALVAMGRTGPREEFGRDTWVDVPMRVSSDARRKVLKLRRQRKLKDLLERTPAYRQLLREYPEAQISPLGDDG